MALKYYETQKALYAQMGMDYDSQMENIFNMSLPYSESSPEHAMVIAGLYRPITTKFSSEEKFIEYLIKAADMGHVEAMTEYGILLIIGKVYVTRDQAKGMEYLNKALELDYYDAKEFMETWNNDPEKYEYDFQGDYYRRNDD